MCFVVLPKDLKATTTTAKEGWGYALKDLFGVDNVDNLVDKYKKKPTLTEIQFEMFWKKYPRKTAKYLAKKTWAKVIDEEGLFKRILDSLEMHKIGKAWNKDQGVYIPHAATWINQRRWEDHEPVKLTPEGQKKLEKRNSELEAVKQREWERINERRFQ